MGFKLLLESSQQPNVRLVQQQRPKKNGNSWTGPSQERNLDMPISMLFSACVLVLQISPRPSFKPQPALSKQASSSITLPLFDAVEGQA